MEFLWSSMTQHTTGNNTEEQEATIENKIMELCREQVERKWQIAVIGTIAQCYPRYRIVIYSGLLHSKDKGTVC